MGAPLRLHQLRCGVACLASILTQCVAEDASPLMRVTRGGPDLVLPTDGVDGLTVRYGIGIPFQVAPRLAGVFANVRTLGPGRWDFEDGTDLVLFDDLSKLAEAEAIVVSRNDYETDSEAGESRIVVKFPVVCGFVPLGAKHADGTPHPHAGTGFGVCQALSFVENGAGLFTWKDKFVRRTEVMQFAFDGERFHVTGRRTYKPGPRIGEGDEAWTIAVPPITAAIPDGDDLLFAPYAYGKQGAGSGVSRWQRIEDEWRPVSFRLIVHGSEASLVRDADDALLFSVRGSGDEVNTVAVWRSTDGGETWQRTLRLTGFRTHSPVSLNCAADGTPYLAANPFGSGRTKLCLWPLDAKRTSLGDPVVIRDCEEFGAPPVKCHWFCDHPSAATLQLADGTWHHVLAYRLLSFGKGKGGELPTQHTGCYLEEVSSGGPARPAWRF